MHLTPFGIIRRTGHRVPPLAAQQGLASDACALRVSSSPDLVAVGLVAPWRSSQLPSSSSCPYVISCQFFRSSAAALLAEATPGGAFLLSVSLFGLRFSPRLQRASSFLTCAGQSEFLGSFAFQFPSHLQSFRWQSRYQILSGTLLPGETIACSIPARCTYCLPGLRVPFST